MTEWILQAELRKRWAVHGVRIEGARCMLVAWEVMVPSWRINSPSRHWNEPSLDFLLADERMNLIVVELKREIRGQVPAWNVLAQVTHRALRVAETATKDLVDSVWKECWSGQRAPFHRTTGSLAEAHRTFFDLPRGATLKDDVGRVVAAQRFGHQWADILGTFNKSSPKVLRSRLEPMSIPKAGKEIRRLLGRPADVVERCLAPVSSLLIGGTDV